jgi:hypothetical protein
MGKLKSDILIAVGYDQTVLPNIWLSSEVFYRNLKTFLGYFRTDGRTGSGRGIP